MPRSEKKEEKTLGRRRSPAMTPEDREDRLTALAFDLAEERLRDGTASNQLISVILRNGTVRERLEKEKLEKENELLVAKVKAIESTARIESLYRDALDAMRSYRGEYREGDEDYQ